ncbi:MAG: deoxynucleoside kinase [Prolixibacteraceae bacterium]|jgi:deoxyguanosine kinase|nr:deoxynucleoside kinase [Prolixibacteraceae bacterium]
MNFLVIEGNIGAGKTTLAKMISEDYNARFVGEAFADNPFLDKFYSDPKSYAFTLEMSFMAERYSQLNNELQSLDLFSNFAVADYYFMKSLIFAGVTLTDDEYTLYRNFFNIIYSRLPRPDLYVYLHKDPDKLIKYIEKRGRDYEKNIKESYLDKVSKSYFSYFKQQSEFPVLVLDTNNVDFVNNNDDYKKICNSIFNKKHKEGITRIIF